MDNLFGKKRLRVVTVGRNLEDLRPLLAPFPADVVESEPDLVISYGGDGSLLGAEQRFPLVPKFPLRDFRCNPKCSAHGDGEVLSRLFRGQLVCTMLPKLVATLEDGTTLFGINDIVIRNEVASSAIRYRLRLNGNLFKGQVVADSLVISTPFGSTGYFRSITRGTFLEGIGLAYNNAMDLESFSVIPGGSAVEIELLRGPAEIAADNNPQTYQLKNGARIKVGVHQECTPVFGIDVFRCEDCYNLRRNGIKEITN